MVDKNDQLDFELARSVANFVRIARGVSVQRGESLIKAIG